MPCQSDPGAGTLRCRLLHWIGNLPHGRAAGHYVVLGTYYLGGRFILQLVGKVSSAREIQPSVLYAIL